jgi:hypothetical protein
MENENENKPLPGPIGRPIRAASKEKLLKMQRVLKTESDTIQKELDRRVEIERVEMEADFLKKVDALLLLVEHSKTSCNDDNRRNDSAHKSGVISCSRCFLLRVKDLEYSLPVPIRDFDLCLTITECKSVKILS